MVKICSDNYINKNEDKYKSYFDKYSFSLSSFQKHAIEAIIEGQHILITAHTGSGKTLPAEFAIEYFTSLPLKKKIIYTSPIKALSNQKYYDFCIKFPNISFGLLTGDIKCNPEADVLIMTSEILLNKLYQINSDSSNISSSISFNMDIEKELACVIMDEVHYINDQDRGKVWEQTIMMLPQHIQMVMLSATLDSPETFALWCETKGQNIKNPDKIVYLTSTYERVVPLTHYSFITVNNSIFKLEKDKSVQASIKNFINKPHILQDAKGKFNDETFTTNNKMLKLFTNKQVYVKRQNVLNQVSKYLCENDMLPALCFVFSRKQLEECAKELTTNLQEFDSKVPYIIKKECEQIIRKLPNYQEYLQLPEYVNMISLLEKGIAIHHAGIMPILREMVELLYAKGYIKILFATETFAVGINMPTKTVLFSSLEKWDGNNTRMLYSHEYTQMAGRAGRRGIDTVGYVIHLNNLFKNNDIVNYKTMMKGQPQKLVSKFRISYNLILNLIDIGNYSFTDFAKRSMIQNDILKDTEKYFYKMNNSMKEMQQIQDSFKYLKTPISILEEYIELQSNRSTSVNSKRKDIDKKLQKIENEYVFINKEKQKCIDYNEKQIEISNIEKQIKESELYIENNVSQILELLKEDDYITIDENDNNYKLTIKGNIANQLKEIHCILFTELIISNKLKSLKVNELVGIFSCFTNITVCEDLRDVVPGDHNKKVQSIILEMVNNYDKQLLKESKKNIYTGTDCNIQFDIIKYSMDWCNCENVEECKYVLQEMGLKKEIFLGEFVKALLKINNISSELEKVAELIGDIELLHTLKEIPGKTLKYVATNQSLYI
jgi:superfamily II RNA helicase